MKKILILCTAMFLACNACAMEGDETHVTPVGRLVRVESVSVTEIDGGFRVELVIEDGDHPPTTPISSDDEQFGEDFEDYYSDDDEERRIMEADARPAA